MLPPELVINAIEANPVHFTWQWRLLRGRDAEDYRGGGWRQMQGKLTKCRKASSGAAFRA